MKESEMKHENGLERAEACYKEGIALVENHYVMDARAFALLEEAADLGLRQAQRFLGSLYQGYVLVKGRVDCFRSRTVDAEKSVRYYRMAAEGGDAESCYRLGCMYQDGLLVDGDPAMAMDWFRRALEMDAPEWSFRSFASAHLGDIYSRGCYLRQGSEASIRAVVPLDILRAAEMYRKSWEDGNLDSGLRLADIYSAVRDTHHAEEIYRILERKGLDEASERLAELEREGLLDAQGPITYE